MMGSKMSRHIRALALFTLVSALAGCGGEEIELNGKIFDAVGLGPNQAKTAEPKLAARAPLVIPPNTQRVPEPGEPAEAAAPEVAALQDPDKVAKVSEEELKKQQAAYCKENYEDAVARGDTAADAAAGPLGPCRGSILSAVQSWTKGDSQ